MYGVLGRRTPGQLDGGGAGVVGGCDDGLAARHLPQCQHVVGVLAVPGPPHGIDGSDPEAVGGEGAEIAGLEDGGVVWGLDDSASASCLVLVPRSILSNPERIFNIILFYFRYFHYYMCIYLMWIR